MILLLEEVMHWERVLITADTCLSTRIGPLMSRLRRYELWHSRNFLWFFNFVDAFHQDALQCLRITTVQRNLKGINTDILDHWYLKAQTSIKNMAMNYLSFNFSVLALRWSVVGKYCERSKEHDWSATDQNRPASPVNDMPSLIICCWTYLRVNEA